MTDATRNQAAAIEAELMGAVYREVDRTMMIVLILEYVAAIVVALTISPSTWYGRVSEPHIHLYGALLLGGLLTFVPVYLVRTAAGEQATRLVIGASQLGYSALFIHLSGGRIETHFHIFGSLAFLAAYRDYKVILVGTVVITIDHVVRALFWPESLFGVLTSGIGRAFEHAAWVVFEDIIIIKSAIQARAEIASLAESQATSAAAAAQAEVQAAEAEEQRKSAHQAEEEARASQAVLEAMVTRLRGTLEQVADRDLAVRLSRSDSELENQVGELLNRALENLDHGFAQVAQSSHTVTAGAQEIAARSEDIARGASSQAAALEEVNSTLQIVTTTAREGDEETSRAAELASHARVAAEGGRARLNELTTALERIRLSANETAKIVSAVNDIAHQTNLLALNAAVEAARAGQAGRGFAVVADEVRALAARSASAASETAKRIQEAIDHAATGADLKNHVVHHFDAIERSVTEVEGAMKAAAGRSTDQRASLEQLADATESIAEQTQVTAAACDDTLRHAQHLHGSGMGLLELVGSFKRTNAGPVATSSFDEQYLH